MNITVKDVPEELHLRLKQVAEESGRSVNKLIIHALGQVILPQRTSRMELVHKIRDRRRSMKGNLSLEELHSYINEGRA
ncbi:MAG: FitA-like ribbon-helix-helix domain-containing protein [Chthoniobacterales bacterium]